MAVYNFSSRMTEQICNRALIVPTSNSAPPRNPPPLAFFFSIAVADHPKIRIRIPKVFVKAMQRKGGENSDEEEDRDQRKKKKRTKKLGKLKRIIPKKVSSILSSVFRRRKSGEGQVKTGDGRVGKEKRGKEYDESRQMKQGKNSGDDHGGDHVHGTVLILKKGSSRRLGRVPSRTLLSCRKVKMGRWMRRNRVNFKLSNGGETDQEEEEEEEEGEVELCKRRILMGVRCRPLSQSGALQYDKDGVLVPDILW